jgi:hypothetical protein
MTERDLKPTVVYGGDINALTSLSSICNGRAESLGLHDKSRQSGLRRAAETCTKLASSLEATGVEPLDDEGWPMWPSQVAAVENGTTELPTAEVELALGDLSLLRIARSLRTTGQVFELPIR